MQPAFKKPKTIYEFQERARQTSLPAAQTMVQSLMRKRQAMTAPLDAEIKYYEKIVQYKKTGKTDWKPEGA